jgi:glycerol dehydrogenase
MTTVVTPEQYLSKPHALVESGKLIAALAKRVYITGSKTALKVAGAALSRSLEDAGVEYTIREYNGYPTDEIAADLAEQAKQTGAQALVAVGGGRIHDAVKTAGAVGGFPVVSVPTIAATCACWAAVSVMYDAEGKFAGLIHHKKSPALVIADTNILAYAPVRYIRS